MNSERVLVVATGVVSPFHLACIYSLLSVEFPDSKIKLLVEQSDFWGRSIIPKRYIDFGVNYFDLDLISSDDEFSAKNANHDFEKVVLIGVTHISIKQYLRLSLNVSPLKLKCYTVEEGVGSYTFTFKRRLANLIEEGVPFVKAISRLSFQFSSLLFVDFLSNTKHFRLAHKPDKRYVDKLKLVFKHISENSEFTGTIDLLFLSQPFKSIGYNESPCDYFLGAIERHESLPVMVKLHPAEMKSVDIESIVEFDGCVEELFYSSGQSIRKVYGISSTSLYTMKILYGIETLRIVSSKYPSVSSNHTLELDILLNKYANDFKIN
ncbi:alpha-2,8-polysialyltransferase family protein [Vibrio vulnificus]|nr:hypothetical protein [Vibrio vulnificus]MCU8461332.1 alpha-2,8-polysialyltransferase family protein [Vibrio vulnificus]